MAGGDGEVPGVGEKVGCAQADECGAGHVSDGQLVGAGEALGFGEGVLRRAGRGAVGDDEAFGQRRRLATRSLYNTLVAGDDMVDERLHIPLWTWRGPRQLVGRDLGKPVSEG